MLHPCRGSGYFPGTLTEYVPFKGVRTVSRLNFPWEFWRNWTSQDGLSGLRTLTVIRDAVALIKKNHNIDVKIDELQMDDPNVFKLIGEDGRRECSNWKVRV